MDLKKKRKNMINIMMTKRRMMAVTSWCLMSRQSRIGSRRLTSLRRHFSPIFIPQHFLLSLFWFSSNFPPFLRFKNFLWYLFLKASHIPFFSESFSFIFYFYLCCNFFSQAKPKISLQFLSGIKYNILGSSSISIVNFSHIVVFLGPRGPHGIPSLVS